MDTRRHRHAGPSQLHGEDDEDMEHTVRYHNDSVMQDALPPDHYKGRDGITGAAKADNRSDAARQEQQCQDSPLRDKQSAVQHDHQQGMRSQAAGSGTRMPSAAELRAELMAARKATSVRPKARPQGTASAAKPRQHRAVAAAAASLHSNKSPKFRIINSPIASPSAANTAAEQRRRLLTGSMLPSHLDTTDPTTPILRRPPVLPEDAIEDLVDGDIPSSAHLFPGSNAIQPCNLNIGATEPPVTPQPHRAIADGGDGATADRSAGPLARQQTPAIGHVPANGATARHALLARLASTPRSDLSRLKPQQRFQVKGSGLYARLQHAVQQADEQINPTVIESRRLEVEVLDTAREAHVIKTRCRCAQPGPPFAFVLFSTKGLRHLDVAVGTQLVLCKWQEVTVSGVGLPVWLCLGAVAKQ